MKAAESLEISRSARRRETLYVPARRSDGLVAVDPTWGRIQPLVLAPGVRTVGELEVIEHIENGLPLVDTRLPHFFAEATLPTAVNIPHTELAERLGELDPAVPAVLFCNGPQCAATPDAVRVLLEHGFPARSILYYRGGLHDWMTLGLPVVSGASSA